MGWRDRMKGAVDRLMLAPAEAGSRVAGRGDRTDRLAFEFELIREQGRPLDY